MCPSVCFVCASHAPRKSAGRGQRHMRTRTRRKELSRGLRRAFLFVAVCHFGAQAEACATASCKTQGGDCMLSECLSCPTLRLTSASLNRASSGRRLSGCGWLALFCCVQRSRRLG